MHRIALGCAALSLAILASQPVAAQQTTSDQTQPTSTPAPAPAESQSVPPPLPPMPSSHHRWIGATEHHATSPHHRQASTHHATAREHHASRDRHSANDRHASHEHRASHGRHAAHEDREVVHASKKTIRKCHGMTYQQIMHSSSCRSLMQQDIEGAEQPRHHRASHKHEVSKHDRKAHGKDSTHHASAHRHSSSRHHDK